MFSRLLKICSIFAVLVSQCPGIAFADELSVYSEDNRLFVAKVSSSTPYTVVEEQFGREIVRFSKPAVPVWVSAGYANIEGEQATVATNGLRLRVRPSMEAQVLTAVFKGHQSVILGKSDDFVQIYAPISIAFSIRKESITDKIPEPIIIGNDESDSPTIPSSSTPAPEVEAVTLVESAAIEIQQFPTQQESRVADDSTRLESPAAEASASEDAASMQKKTSVNLPTVQDEAQAIAEQHRLAPGDTISLLVFGEKDLSIARVRIPESGRVSFPLIGSVEVAGKNAKEVENNVRNSLAQGYVRNPKLSVTIDSYRPIFVKGAIVSTGSFPYTEGLTISKVLALAGGAKNSAKKNGVSISRDGAVVQSGLAIDSEHRILSGDIINVEEEYGVSGEPAFYVYLHGEVSRPGEYLFRRGLTVEKAVVLAGGFTLRASRRKISISRIVEGEEEPIKLKKVALHLPIEPGDIIDIGASWF